MSARFSNGLRIGLALLGVSAGIAPCLLFACGSAAKTGIGSSSSDDASITTVVTYGGGAPGASSSGGAPLDPFSRSSISDGGSSSGGGHAANGSSSGGVHASSSGGSSSSGSSSSGAGSSSSGGSSSGGFIYVGSSADASPDAPQSCDNYTAPMCGPMPCDLRSNTCCVDLSGNSRCIPGANARCNPNEATGHCLQQCECSGGQVCCGVENSIVGVVQTSCQTIPDGGHCPPYPQTATSAAAQLCAFNSECKTGEDCITQTCIYNIVVQVCGLQSQAPFNCHQ